MGEDNHNHSDNVVAFPRKSASGRGRKRKGAARRKEPAVPAVERKTSAQNDDHLNLRDEIPAVDQPEVFELSAMSEADASIAAFIARARQDLPLGFSVHVPKKMICRYDDRIGIDLICSLFRVEARLRSPDGEDWSRKIAFIDRDGNLRSHIIKDEDLIGNAVKICRALVNAGFDLRLPPLDFIALLNWMPVEQSAFAVLQPGWFTPPDNTPPHFICTDGNVISPPGADLGSVEFIGQHRNASLAGTLEGWRDEVARLAERNPILVLSLSAALTAPLLRILDVDMIGFNFFGQSSTGKTTTALVGLSCGQGRAGLHQWNATHVGLELLARQASDSLLALDEFPPRPTKQLMDALYSIGNGTGRARSSSSIGLRQTNHWRTVVLSTSEAGLIEAFGRSGMEVPDGIGVRLIDIPASSWKHGLYDELHGCVNGAALSARLRHATEQHHGQASRYFIEKLVRVSADKIRAAARISAEKVRKALDLHPSEQTGTVLRIIDRFGAAVTAGELGIAFGLLPWGRGSALQNITEVAKVWLEHRRSSAEPLLEDLVSALRTALTAMSEQLPMIDVQRGIPADALDAAGWLMPDWVLLRQRAVIDRIIGDRDPDQILSLLQGAQMLVPGGEARSKQYKMPARLHPDRLRVYRLNRAALQW